MPQINAKVPDISKPELVPIQEPEEKEAESPLKGRIVTLLGSHRTYYWCSTIGTVAGMVIGFYAANLARNYSLFSATSQAVFASTLSEASATLTPYVDSCVTCNIKPTAEIDAELMQIIANNKENFGVLESVAANIGKAKAPTLNTLKTATTFVKEASHGDVPLHFFSLSNWLGAIIGAVAGNTLGERMFTWLDS